MTTPPPPASAGTPTSPPAPTAPSAPAPATSGFAQIADQAGQVAGQVLNQAPAIEGVFASLPQASRIKAAALKIAGELHAGMSHLFAHHSISDLIKDAREIETYLNEGLDKVEGKPVA